MKLKIQPQATALTSSGKSKGTYERKQACQKLGTVYLTTLALVPLAGLTFFYLPAMILLQWLSDLFIYTPGIQDL